MFWPKCKTLQFCALLGTEASSQMNGRGVFVSLSRKGRLIARTEKSTVEWWCSQCWARSLLWVLVLKLTAANLINNYPSSQALHQRGQRLTVSLPFRSSPNADKSFSRSCLQPMLISATHSIQWIGTPSGGFLVFVGCQQNWSIQCLNSTLVLRVLWDVVVPSLTYFQ